MLVAKPVLASRPVHILQKLAWHSCVVPTVQRKHAKHSAKSKDNMSAGLTSLASFWFRTLNCWGRTCNVPHPYFWKNFPMEDIKRRVSHEIACHCGEMLPISDFGLGGFKITVRFNSLSLDPSICFSGHSGAQHQDSVEYHLTFFWRRLFYFPISVWMFPVRHAFDVKLSSCFGSPLIEICRFLVH